MRRDPVAAAIISIVHLAGNRVHRTKLVKLVYLVDLRFHGLTGQTLTGLRYMWDNYGPNAVSNAIVKEADRLAFDGDLRMAVRESAYGTHSFLYWALDAEAEQSLSALGPGGRQVVLDVVREYGKLSVRDIVATSKRTKPFLKAHQYEVLAFDESRESAGHDTLFDEAALEEMRRGLQDAQRGDFVTQDEIDRRYRRRSASQ